MHIGFDGATHFDLSDIRTQLHIKRWKEALNAFFYQFEFQIPADFRTGRLQGFGYDDLRVGRLVSDAMTVVRTKVHVARDSQDAYLVTMSGACPIAITQGGRVAQIGKGNFTVVNINEASSHHQYETTAFTSVVVPGHLMRRFVPRVDDSVAVTFGTKPLHKIFYDLVSAWSTEGGKLYSLHARDIVGEKIVELLGLVIEGADHTSGESVIRLAHSRHIQRIIQEHYANPLLNVSFLSMRMGLSARWIRSILMAQSTTLTRLIKERRIAEALWLLASPKGHKLSVRTIAQSVGYGSFEQFCRDLEVIVGHPISKISSEF